MKGERGYRTGGRGFILHTTMLDHASRPGESTHVLKVSLVVSSCYVGRLSSFHALLYRRSGGEKECHVHEASVHNARAWLEHITRRVEMSVSQISLVIDTHPESRHCLAAEQIS